MQQYQVPQFIMVEDRIIGPLTLKQFLYLLGAAAIGLIGWSLLHLVLFLVVVPPIAGFLVAMAFAKVNSQSFPTVVFNAASYFLKPRLYLWRRVEGKKLQAPRPAGAKKPEPMLATLPKFTESKLNDLAWSLDIKERLGDRG